MKKQTANTFHNTTKQHTAVWLHNLTAYKKRNIALNLIKKTTLLTNHTLFKEHLKLATHAAKSQLLLAVFQLATHADATNQRQSLLKTIEGLLKGPFLLEIIFFEFDNESMKRFWLIWVIAFGLEAVDFPYDLHLTSLPGKNPKAVVCAHGMGGDYNIARWVKSDKRRIGFNFPDYNFHSRGITADQTTFGTIDELLPLIYVIKKGSEGQNEIDLYGFSAGGAAIINAIGVLNTSRFDESLKTIGISQKEKEQMLQAIQRGRVILDAPLKSVREMADHLGPNRELEVFAKRYLENGMDPIDSMKHLQGLSLDIVLHFQKPDEVLSNRDDDLFYSRLKVANSAGRTRLITGSDYGHQLPHPSLWKGI